MPCCATVLRNRSSVRPACHGRVAPRPLAHLPATSSPGLRSPAAMHCMARHGTAGHGNAPCVGAQLCRSTMRARPHRPALLCFANRTGHSRQRLPTVARTAQETPPCTYSCRARFRQCWRVECSRTSLSGSSARRATRCSGTTTLRPRWCTCPSRFGRASVCAVGDHTGSLGGCAWLRNFGNSILTGVARAEQRHREHAWLQGQLDRRGRLDRSALHPSAPSARSHTSAVATVHRRRDNQCNQTGVLARAAGLIACATRLRTVARAAAERFGPCGDRRRTVRLRAAPGFESASAAAEPRCAEIAERKFFTLPLPRGTAKFDPSTRWPCPVHLPRSSFCAPCFSLSFSAPIHTPIPSRLRPRHIPQPIDQSLPQADHVRAGVGSDLRAVPRRRVRRVGPRRSDPRSPHVLPARRCHSAVATALRLNRLYCERRQRATVSHRSGSLRVQRRQGARAARDGAGARRAMASAGSAAGHLDSRAAGARTARARRAAEVYA